MLSGWLASKVSRVLCRVAHRHTSYCRGRADHVRDGQIIDPGRWAR